MKPPFYWEGKRLSATELNRQNRQNRRGNITSVKGGTAHSTERGTVIEVRPGDRSIRTSVVLTPFFVSVIKEGEVWKIAVNPGTLNGGTPLVGAVTGSGGSALTTATRINLASGKNLVVLGVKTNLETRAISRLTIEVAEDTDITPVVNTGARTRITYIVLAELEESVSPAGWVKLSQAVTTNLQYFTAGTTDFVWRV